MDNVSEINKQNEFHVECIGHDIRSTQFGKGGCCDTLMANEYKDPSIVAYAIENHPCDSRVTMDDSGIVQTLNARMGTGGGNTPFVLVEDLTCESNVVGEQKICYPKITGALCAAGYSKLGLQEVFNGMYVTLYDGTQIAPTLTANNAGGGQRMPDKENFNAVIEEAIPPRKYVLRRLTPMECLRLQGLPDWWCDDVNGSDSAVYKMAGNGLAIPCACDILGRIAMEMKKDV